MILALVSATFLAVGGMGPAPEQEPTSRAIVPQASQTRGDRPAADRPQEDPSVETPQEPQSEEPTPPVSSEPKLATFGGGCFWCTEAVFELVKGVHDVVSGYAGGQVPFPSYDAVCTGRTGHAEVVQVTYDPSVISYAELLEIFWRTHDPTTLNRQGPDIGTQYRSIILCHDAEQREIAEGLKKRLNENKVFKRPVVTQVVPFQVFYPAEPYHQDYFRKNPSAGYCQMMIVPKLKKFSQTFREKMR
ncbi:peptide-methionine (S)-S-oxide reductase MsrA [Tautonia sp. JC769]|uniref:peptide-methionine (S)-S-oxide reductase MsrA n=1 Tax=Tautonia sp. JC769 TaxID=3232135 RepID=UPI00345A3176